MFKRETILAADIGGTNTRFLLHEIKVTDESIETICAIDTLKVGDDSLGQLILNRKYQNQDYASFVDVLQQFLDDAHVKQPPSTACFAVAGPVKDNVVRFTNRDGWAIDGEEIQNKFHIPRVELINDFVAAGYGVLTLDEPTECVKLQDAPKLLDAPIACLGPGTGLGECFLTPGKEGGGYKCYPSEGGHAEFAPRDDLQVAMLEYLKTKFKQKNRVSVERVVSGTALPNVYEFLCEQNPEDVDPSIHQEIEKAGDMKGGVIAKHVEDYILCKRTMEIFVTALGAEAGVVGLKFLPYGGLYLLGGLTPKNIELIKDEQYGFMHAFHDKGRVSGMLCSVPLFAVLVENLGERGALLNSFKLLQEELRDSEMMIEVLANSRQRGSSASGSGLSRTRSKSGSFFRSRNNSTLSLVNAGASGIGLGIGAGGGYYGSAPGAMYSGGRQRGFSNASRLDRQSSAGGGRGYLEDGIQDSQTMPPGGMDRSYSISSNRRGDLRTRGSTSDRPGGDEAPFNYSLSHIEPPLSTFTPDEDIVTGGVKKTLSALQEGGSDTSLNRSATGGGGGAGGGKGTGGGAGGFTLLHLMLASSFTMAGMIIGITILKRKNML